MSFKCTNIECSAPEKKKGREYPSAMECPFCDVPLVEFSIIYKTCIRLAKELGKERELPEWIKEFKK